MMKKVSKKEFDHFIVKFPRKLERDVNAICEPPLITYNDFSVGLWPDSVVASCMMDYYDTSKIDPESYKIETRFLEEIQRVFGYDYAK